MLWDNAIGDDGACFLANALASEKRPRLRKLSVAVNAINNVGVDALCGSLADNASLRMLSLSGNIFDDNAVASIGKMLELNRTLRELYLSEIVNLQRSDATLAAALLVNDTLICYSGCGGPLPTLETRALSAEARRAAKERLAKGTTGDDEDDEDDDALDVQS
jgi:hypothetical protein